MSFCGGYNRPSKVVSECQKVDLTIPAIKTTWPQGKHPHGLLGGGLKALENLFPGFGNELMRAGAEPMEPGFDMLYEIPGQDVWPRIKLSWPTYSMSRPLIERTLIFLMG